MKILSIQLQEGGYYGFAFDDGQYSMLRALSGKQADQMDLGEYCNYEEFVILQNSRNIIHQES